jgi:hypothetical protein
MARVGNGAGANNVPNPDEMLAILQGDARQSQYGLSDDEMMGAYAQMSPQRAKGLISPLASLPTAASTGEFFEAIAIFNDDDDSMGYYNPKQSGAKFSTSPNGPWVNSGTPVGYGQAWRARQAPAPLTVVPTSTSNPERPRTVAAGYDRTTKTLTVVFRDGTYYNYYDIPPVMWQEFKQRKSKGKYIYMYLDNYARGPADISNIPDYAREALYRITRTSQVLRSNRKNTVTRPWQQINRTGKMPYPKRGRK